MTPTQPLTVDRQRRSDNIPDIVALSFFSGAMGLDIGMRHGGIRALLACENNKYCRMTIAENDPDIALIGDIENYDPDDIFRFANLPTGQKVDVMFAGPPCQSFSTAGSRKALDDARGNVFLHYIDLVKAIRPTYVVIENVRGLLSARYPFGGSKEPIKGGAFSVILERLKAAGYTVSFELYNAANFGAPQIRERVILIGKLGDQKVPYLSPTHSEDGSHGLPHWRTLADAIRGLSPNQQHFIQFPEKRLRFYRMLQQGEYWKDLPPEFQREAMGDKLRLGGGKTGFFRRLRFDRPSPTLVTNPTMPATDLCHPTEDRPLSVEEYLRIQEFPDDWVICGPLLEQYRQIGNAVPIKMGEAIARTLLADMHAETLPHYNGFRYSRYQATNEKSWQAAVREKPTEKAKETPPRSGSTGTGKKERKRMAQSYTIANRNINEETLREYYQRETESLSETLRAELDPMFQFALANRDRFPKLNIAPKNQTPETYIERWVKGYVEARTHLPSSHTANPKTACTDPAIRLITKTARGLTEEELATGERFHNLFMSAENILGALLEEYIAQCLRPYGILWCAGSILRAIDFFGLNGNFLLQVKNKSSTENSSSSTIRNGTTIQKWYRLGTKTENHVRLPVYRWDILNELINQQLADPGLGPCEMTEPGYQAFLRKTVSANHTLITDR